MVNPKVGDFVDRARPVGKLLEAELLLAEILKVSREEVFAHPERGLSKEECARFERFWERIEDGEPLAYVLGKKEFFGLEFTVDSRVLVPRPETEHLVSTVLELVGRDYGGAVDAPRILDVGTGCGAIAVALAYALSGRVGARVFASDVSAEALEVARVNAERILGSGRPVSQGVDFFQSDLLNDVPWTTLNLDVLVANLPYIGRKEFHFVEASVDRYEPSVALYGGADGLDLYRRLFEQINCSTERGVWPRWVLGEFGCFQRERLEALIHEVFPSAPVSFYTDLAGLDRFFVLSLLVGRGRSSRHDGTHMPPRPALRSAKPI